MERFDRNFVCNGSDDGGRYTYAAQPNVVHFNLEQLARALGGICPPLKTDARLRMAPYWSAYTGTRHALFRKKLGLVSEDLGREAKVEEMDVELIDALLETMEGTGCDFSNAFRALSLVEMPGELGPRGLTDQGLSFPSLRCAAPLFCSTYFTAVTFIVLRNSSLIS